MLTTGATQTPKIKLPYPHQGQQAVINTAKRHNWLSAGRRWRKTSMLATMIMIENAVKARGDYMWCAPTFDQVRIGMTEARRACGHIADFNLSRMVAEFPNRSKIFYRSLDDPDNARGYTLNGVGIDECADVKQEAWYEVLRPTLIDTNGWSWGIGTPKGRNWFFREHMAALGMDNVMSWQAPTVGCTIVGSSLVRKPHPLENPFVAFEEIERLWATMPERTFRQEILAEFIEGEGSVFRNIAACTNAPEGVPGQHAGHTIVAGLDLAKQNDFTAISIGCRDCRVEIARDRFNQVDYLFQVGRIKAICERWGVQSLLVDSTGVGSPILEQLQSDGLPANGFVFTATSKPPLVENMALTLERTEWQFQEDRVWTMELEAYERTVSPTTGRSSYSAPEGSHDDCVMARCLMLWQARNSVSLFSIL